MDQMTKGCGMADIINLRRARKAAQRQEREKMAAHNRAAHSIPAAERRLRLDQTDIDRRRLDGHRNADAGDAGDGRQRTGPDLER